MGLFDALKKKLKIINMKASEALLEGSEVDLAKLSKDELESKVAEIRKAEANIAAEIKSAQRKKDEFLKKAKEAYLAAKKYQQSGNTDAAQKCALRAQDLMQSVSELDTIIQTSEAQRQKVEKKRRELEHFLSQADMKIASMQAIKATADAIKTASKIDTSTSTPSTIDSLYEKLQKQLDAAEYEDKAVTKDETEELIAMANKETDTNALLSNLDSMFGELKLEHKKEGN